MGSRNFFARFNPGTERSNRSMLSLIGRTPSGVSSPFQIRSNLRAGSAELITIGTFFTGLCGSPPTLGPHSLTSGWLIVVHRGLVPSPLGINGFCVNVAPHRSSPIFRIARPPGWFFGISDKCPRWPNDAPCENLSGCHPRFVESGFCASVYRWRERYQPEHTRLIGARLPDHCALALPATETKRAPGIGSRGRAQSNCNELRCGPCAFWDGMVVRTLALFPASRSFRLLLLRL